MSLRVLIRNCCVGLCQPASHRGVTSNPDRPVLQRSSQVQNRKRQKRQLRSRFELANRHIMLKVKVDGSRPLSFVLDTGDKYAIVDLDRAKELGLKLQGQIRVGGAGAGTQTGAFVEGSNFTIPGFEGFVQPVRMALPIGRMAQGLGQAFDGIIGYDFIKEFVVEIDYQARVIRLHDKDKFTYSGPGESIPISLDAAGHGNGHPILEAEVTPTGGAPIKGKLRLDIGSGLALALHSPFVKEHGLLAPERKTIKTFGAGAGGEINARLGRVSELKIGKFKILNPVTLFSEDTAGAFANQSLAGNIGAQIASKFRVFWTMVGAESSSNQIPLSRTLLNVLPPGSGFMQKARISAPSGSRTCWKIHPRQKPDSNKMTSSPISRGNRLRNLRLQS